MFFSGADSDEEEVSDSDHRGGGAFAAGVGTSPPDQAEDSIRDSPRRDSPDYGDNDQPDEGAQDGHEHGDRADDVQVPDWSDDGPDSGPECEGRFHTTGMSSHLTKLDSLTARGCADKFFNVHTSRWAPEMARPGDYLHSARAGGDDVRDSRKRKASNITRSAAESHAFCSSTNLSQKHSDAHMEAFSNVSTFMMQISNFFIRVS